MKLGDMFIVIIALLGAIIILLSGCEGERGLIGVKGMQGERGLQGESGAIGRVLIEGVASQSIEKVIILNWSLDDIPVINIYFENKFIADTWEVFPTSRSRYRLNSNGIEMIGIQNVVDLSGGADYKIILGY